MNIVRLLAQLRGVLAADVRKHDVLVGAGWLRDILRLLTNVERQAERAACSARAV